MANLNLNLDIKSFLPKLVKNLSWVFFGVFVLLIIFEVFELKQSVQIILASNTEVAQPAAQKGVRINFDAYNQVVNKIQGGQTFVPSGGITKNPFGAGK